MSIVSRPSLVELGHLVLIAFSPLLCLFLAHALSAADNNILSAIQIMSIISILLTIFLRSGRHLLRKSFKKLGDWHIFLTLSSSVFLLTGSFPVTLIEPWQAISFISIVAGIILFGAVIVNVLWKQLF